MIKLTMIFRLSLIILMLCGGLIFCTAQNKKAYPTGISIDPDIESTVKKMKKKVNEFATYVYNNDTLQKNALLDAGSKLLLDPLVNIANGDTTLIFMNMFIPMGFEIGLKTDSLRVQYFASSRSCKCFKSKLEEPNLRYGAGAEPAELTLVLNKKSGFNKGDMIYGYIKLSGGGFYFSPDDGSTFQRRSYSYEGYFKAEFNPMSIK